MPMKRRKKDTINLVGVNVVHNQCMYASNMFAGACLKRETTQQMNRLRGTTWSKGKLERKKKKIAPITNCELHSFDSCLLTHLTI